MSQLVSVIISAYNAEKYIKRCLDSVVNQTYSSIEIIVCDDGSTDSTAEVIKSYGEKVKYVYQNNSGQGAGRNNAVQHSQGKYLAFIDADDVWKSNKIQRQIDLFLESHFSVGCIYCNMEIVNEFDNFIRLFCPKDRMRKGEILAELLKDSFIGLSSIIVRRNIFEEVGGFTNHRYCQDFAFLVKVAKKYEFDYIDSPLVKYRDHFQSLSRNIEVSYPDTINFLSSLLGDNDLNENHKLNIRKQLKKNFISYAFWNHINKNYDKVKQIILQSKEMDIMSWKLKVLYIFNNKTFGFIINSYYKIKN